MEIRAKKRFRTKAERRQIVEETLQPGASVSRVARSHDVNANQVFHWRQQYRKGWFNEGAKTETALVPVKITASIGKRSASAPRPKSVQPTLGSIEIDLGHARVRIEGTADPDCIRAALEGLVR